LAQAGQGLAGGGVMRNAIDAEQQTADARGKITPFIPLTLRGRFKRRSSFGIWAFGFQLSFGFCHLDLSGAWDLATGIAAHLSGARNDSRGHAQAYKRS